MASPLIVTGASGQLGRRVVELLLERKAGPIVATTRHPEKLADLAAKGVTVRKADFDDTASLTQAFAGGGRLLIVSTDALDRPGRRLEQHQRAIVAAEKAGVSHVVYTSLTNPLPSSKIMIAGDHRDTEAVLEKTKLGFTVLRNNMYSDLLLGSLAHAAKTGVLRSAAGQGSIGLVTREDCARAAAGALMATFEGRRVLDVTGPELVTRTQLAAITSELTGKPVRYDAISVGELEGDLRAMGLPPPVAAVLGSFDAAIADGELAVVGTAVKDLWGTPATSVRSFLTSQRAALG